MPALVLPCALADTVPLCSSNPLQIRFAILTRVETRYGLLSADFYHLYKAGELEQSRDFIQWIGYYEAKLEREFLSPSLPS